MAQTDATLVDKNGNNIYPRTTTKGIIDLEDVLVTKDGIKPLYDNLGSLEKKIEDFDSNNTGWGNWRKDGMSLLNGAQQYAGDQDYPMYRTRKVNGNIQVQISFRIKNVTAGNDTAYVGFPTALSSSSPTQWGLSMPTSNGRTASWVIRSGNICLHANSDNVFSGEYWYPFLATMEVN